ncbi:hypothetical protein EH165_05175 [Nakamurella antarctica]|uniref:Uncharacterized protein n=1 Tax=Nakamurella antarctica TaxID=1902245 RepID=A0A3G8ZT16_9ACTN|nr:hypothetical protein [Nakamurella antarctica]AZI57634.1 hypothetical protein EH165_05175 [Nakamurella antarctica]
MFKSHQYLRRLAGIVSLLVAATVALVVPAVLEPAVTGRPAPVALPVAPPIGACVVVALGRVTQVDCDEVHTGEIAMSWGRGVNPWAKYHVGGAGPSAVDMPSAGQSTDAVCQDWARDYVGAVVDSDAAALGSWRPVPPFFTVTLIKGPGGSPQLDWSACMVGATRSELYVGAVGGAGVSIDRARPDAFTTCLDLGIQALRELRYVACDQPHRIEFLATLQVDQAMVDAGEVYTAGSGGLAADCKQLISAMTGNDDPTFGGRIEVRTEALWQRGTTPQPAVPGSGQLAIPDCFVELSGSGQLIGSVVGLGDAALPTG